MAKLLLKWFIYLILALLFAVPLLVLVFIICAFAFAAAFVEALEDERRMAQQIALAAAARGWRRAT